MPRSYDDGLCVRVAPVETASVTILEEMAHAAKSSQKIVVFKAVASIPLLLSKNAKLFTSWVLTGEGAARGG